MANDPIFQEAIRRIFNLCKLRKSTAAVEVLASLLNDRLLSMSINRAWICCDISGELEKNKDLESSLQFLIFGLSGKLNHSDESLLRHSLAVHYHKRGLLQLAAANFRIAAGLAARGKVSGNDQATTLICLSISLSALGRQGEAREAAKEANQNLISCTASNDLRATAETIWMRERVATSTPVARNRARTCLNIAPRGLSPELNNKQMLLEESIRPSKPVIFELPQVVAKPQRFQTLT